MSLRSEMTRVVFVKRLRLKIPPNCCDHCVNLSLKISASKAKSSYSLKKGCGDLQKMAVSGRNLMFVA